MRKLLYWLNKPHPYLIVIAIVLISCSAFSDDRKELDKIQREGNAYYRVNMKAVNLVSLGTDYAPQRAFQVLPKNNPASCSHTAAIKVHMIRERLPHLNPKIAVYQMRDGFYHAVPVIQRADGSYWFLNNTTNWVREYDSLDGLSDLQIATLEQWQEAYDVATD